MADKKTKEAFKLLYGEFNEDYGKIADIMVKHFLPYSKEIHKLSHKNPEMASRMIGVTIVQLLQPLTKEGRKRILETALKTLEQQKEIDKDTEALNTLIKNLGDE
ncbi:hypothetical protein LCGC14_1448570 [marine sediment metagenome]|uniref:Uncharacterized protein n=1 Tax=marine sediment metagenome TaxID=412755 RepID=A0A0F9K4S3_9ZZZZ